MKFKIGDEVIRFQETIMSYGKSHPNHFTVYRIEGGSPISIPTCVFPKTGNGTYEVDLRLATKLDKVLK